ncbi:MAG: potassium channel family protein [Flavobacteriaceae bacterium]
MLESIKKVLDDHGLTAVLLLVALSFFVFIIPTLDLESSFLPILLISIIIFLAASTISRRLVFLGIVLIVIEVAMRTTDFVYLNYLAIVTTNLFILYIVARAIGEIMAEKTVSLFTILEAVNGYLLLGILFISLVGFVELIFPGSYPFTEGEEINLVYYTMVTLTTVGYGDITPQLPAAKSLAMIMAVTGQFYIAVVVAIIVGKYASKQ